MPDRPDTADCAADPLGSTDPPRDLREEDTWRACSRLLHATFEQWKAHRRVFGPYDHDELCCAPCAALVDLNLAPTARDQ